ncbi:vesicle-trafficking protein SEC22c isoform X1 [Varanus komodoensis]|uniref:SEC22 homolog C, vesicle trafficking protein n=1 Tax=Varanus komodoensis TaxID=61221 RepID=A0A8D2Q652_VARKO|nr:vesicle-trafficking protein SEC22c isoform X1 [Varanus komodoensis]XP_044281197.1 vesicle-trafficking protein SEC22c isoform X1 [Varanus komodoensis]
MSMILFACVVRVRDGLPLSASTDFHLDQDFLECRKKLKALSSILTCYPDRGTANERDLRIHFHSSGDVACMGICNSSYPAVMAFCFLDELQWEFATSYDAASVGLASRPYAFLEFDNVIQKVKSRFNYTSDAQTKFNLEKIREELRLHPPALVKLEELEMRNGMVNGHAELHVEPAPAYRMQPVSALGILSLVLNIMCGALNLIRGVHLAEYSFQEDHKGIGNVIAFLLPFAACFLSCYLYLFYSSARKIKVFVLFVTVCLCNFYLYGLRNVWQILFHIGVACLSSHQILSRQVVEKHSDFGGV